MYGYPKKLVVFKLQCPQYPSAFSIINVWQPKKMHKKGQCGIDAILQFILSCPYRKELLIVEESFALRSECVLCLGWLFRHFVFFSLSTISFGPITASNYLFIYLFCNFSWWGNEYSIFAVTCTIKQYFEGRRVYATMWILLLKKLLGTTGRKSSRVHLHENSSVQGHSGALQFLSFFLTWGESLS